MHNDIFKESYKTQSNICILCERYACMYKKYKTYVGRQIPNAKQCLHLQQVSFRTEKDRGNFNHNTSLCIP